MKSVKDWIAFEAAPFPLQPATITSQPLSEDQHILFLEVLLLFVEHL